MTLWLVMAVWREKFVRSLAVLCTPLLEFVEFVFCVIARERPSSSSNADLRFRIDGRLAAIDEFGLDTHGEFFGGGSGGSLSTESDP
jgi:hypothetical protein